MAVSAEHLASIAASVQAVEALAAQAPASISGADKLAAATALATAANPELAVKASAVSTIIGSLVGILNVFGIFKKKSAAPQA